MPEMRFRVCWPDAAVTVHYSPSLVVEEHLTQGSSYDLADFLDRARTALDLASERVRAKYGTPCSRALAERTRIEERAAMFREGRVTIVAFQRVAHEPTS